MSKRVLPRDYTAEEMDRGEGMVFHPCEGYPRVGEVFKPLDYVKGVVFDSDAHAFVMDGGYNMSRYLKRIGDGKPHKVGKPYPDHWMFDPYTGEKIWVKNYDMYWYMENPILPPGFDQDDL